MRRDDQKLPEETTVLSVPVRGQRVPETRQTVVPQWPSPSSSIAYCGLSMGARKSRAVPLSVETLRPPLSSGLDFRRARGHPGVSVRGHSRRYRLPAHRLRPDAGSLLRSGMPPLARLLEVARTFPAGVGAENRGGAPSGCTDLQARVDVPIGFRRPGMAPTQQAESILASL
ncbi:MAG: hypothetical protein ACI80V_002167 [Rhodothermales bacterium]|jgi:hypothetical protein